MLIRGPRPTLGDQKSSNAHWQFSMARVIQPYVKLYFQYQPIKIYQVYFTTTKYQRQCAKCTICKQHNAAY